VTAPLACGPPGRRSLGVIATVTGTDLTPAVSLSAWMRGNIVTIDTPVWLNSNVGHLRDWDLAIESRVNRGNHFEALGLFGGFPGSSAAPPSDMKIRINCVRTAEAVANRRSHVAAARYFGGLFDSSTVSLEISGVAQQAFQFFNPATPGFVMPQISTTNFRRV
jgi:hypothetical protein